MMARCEDEGFYGGAAGGGKSDMLIIEALRQVEPRALTTPIPVTATRCVDMLLDMIQIIPNSNRQRYGII